MMFCPECGGLVIPKGEGKKKYMGCTKCKYKNKEMEEIKISEKMKDSAPVEVIEEEVQTHPIVSKDCPKCENDKAAFWSIQTRAGDEPETEFYKCTKCKHQWRENN